MLTQSGKKMHNCLECKNSFGRAGHLKSHMLTHSGVKAHNCSECKKSFGLAGHLKKTTSLQIKLLQGI